MPKLTLSTGEVLNVVEPKKNHGVVGRVNKARDAGKFATVKVSGGEGTVLVNPDHVVAVD